ncbi:hypothetical protein QCA50_004382 [Cerrena zonata]|uniref:Uncharacterized protein n=1 Tax=Cerrena zonata TaxID=2478898 RepID=A0AAW0GNU3_9APHY
MNSRLLFLLNHHHLHPHPRKLLHLRGLKAVISEMDYAPRSCVGFDGHLFLLHPIPVAQSLLTGHQQGKWDHGHFAAASFHVWGDPGTPRSTIIVLSQDKIISSLAFSHQPSAQRQNDYEEHSLRMRYGLSEWFPSYPTFDTASVR